MFKKSSKVKVLITKEEQAQIPEYATPGSAGCDVRAIEETIVPPNSVIAVRTGIRLAIPEGVEAQLRPRSGLSLKTPLRLANSPGTIDSDYRGEIKVLVWNTGQEEYKIEAGTKIAQLVFVPILQADFVLTNTLDDTQRREGGFGSTGIK